MRWTPLLLSLLFLAACGQQKEGEGQADDGVGNAAGNREMALETIYSGLGRNRLCQKGRRAGFIVYAPTGDTNCSVRGTFERRGDRLIIQPDGDADCRIEAREDASSLVLGPVAPECRYYCGPNASFAGAVFDMVSASLPVIDLAGDPLC